jgi:hypothetical protein
VALPSLHWLIGGSSDLGLYLNSLSPNQIQSADGTAVVATSIGILMSPAPYSKVLVTPVYTLLMTRNIPAPNNAHPPAFRFISAFSPLG